VTDHCEFCELPPTMRHEPQSDAVPATYGYRLSCTRHRHWTRHLMQTDLGHVRVIETRLEGEP
jgi:hypothetical protein